MLHEYIFTHTHNHRILSCLPWIPYHGRNSTKLRGRGGILDLSSRRYASASASACAACKALHAATRIWKIGNEFEIGKCILCRRAVGHTCNSKQSTPCIISSRLREVNTQTSYRHQTLRVREYISTEDKKMASWSPCMTNTTPMHSIAFRPPTNHMVQDLILSTYAEYL